MSVLSAEIDPMVQSSFEVKDVFQLEDGEVEYKVTYTERSKGSFEQLHRQLSAKGYTPWLSGSPQECILQIKKKVSGPQSLSRIPIITALLTAGAIILFALLLGQVYSCVAPGLGFLYVVSLYVAGVSLILAFHELGHRIAAKRRGEPSPSSYAIPGAPYVTYFLPSLGFISPFKEPTTNKDGFFDIMIAGPLAAFAITLVLSVLGELTQVPSMIQAGGNQLAACQVQIGNPSLVQIALGRMLAALAPSTSGLIGVSPLGDAAGVGMILTFVSLLPLAFFDGGYLSYAVFGGRIARVLTYIGILVLLTFDAPYYWVLAIVVLLMAARPFNVQTCDEVSPVSERRKLVFLLALALAFLVVPIPGTLATFPLG